VNRRTVIGLAALLLVAAACGSGGSGGSDGASGGSAGGTGAASGSAGPRPASTGTLTIVSPKNGAVVHGTSVTLTVNLEGAKLVQQTTTDVQPDEGHLHVFLDDSLISMTEGTTQKIDDLSAGVHRIQVEFVASDHAPFDPRVTAAATFDVRP
jgi:hypothetical protein